MVNPSDKSCITCKFGFGFSSEVNKTESRCQWAGTSGFLLTKMPSELTFSFKNRGWSFVILRNRPYVNCDVYIEGQIHSS